MKRWMWPALMLAAHIGFWRELILPYEDGPILLLWLLFPIYPIMHWPDQPERAIS